MSKIGLCAIIKDCDEQYLIDWIEWHQFIGIDYFFIYDNESQNPIRSIIPPSENIIITSIKGEVMQISAYEDCISKQKKGEAPICEWIAFIDDDEYIVPECGNIKTVLKSYRKFSALGINWMVFGSSGLKQKTSTPLPVKFTHVLDHSYLNEDGINAFNAHIKSIVKPKDVISFTSPHSCIFEKPKITKYWKKYGLGLRTLLKPKGLCVDIDHNIIPYAFSSKPIYKKMWLAHYYLKSEEEFKLKISRGRADTNEEKYQRRLNDFYEMDALCKTENTFVKDLYLKFKRAQGL
jgi:hypothetical protein